ncbi:hypothetical protein GGI35DRAFT_359463 [Trichoderma velutinum]
MKPVKKMWEKTRTPTPTSSYALANPGLSCFTPVRHGFPGPRRRQSLPSNPRPTSYQNLIIFIFVTNTSERAFTCEIGTPALILLYPPPCRGQPFPSAARTCSGGTRGPLWLFGTGKRDYSATRGLLPPALSAKTHARAITTKLLGGNQVARIGEPWSPEAGPEWPKTRVRQGQVSFRERPDPPSKSEDPGPDCSP